MKIKFVKIKNFRGYRKEVVVNFDNLTAFVGKNDIGKSTILEALDIFFNEGSGSGVIKPDVKDINVDSYKAGEAEFVITVGFVDVPDKVVVDDSYETSLADEYILNEDGLLVIEKKFSFTSRVKTVTRIIAFHPINKGCDDLLLKKNSELKEIIKSNGITCESTKINAIMRRAIREHYKDILEFREIAIDVSKEGAKQIYEKLEQILPVYSLFQSDRKNSDGDAEIQDPLKEAVKQILQDPEIIDKLEFVTNRVCDYLKGVADKTLEKLREIDNKIANSLQPDIPDISKLKWADVFKTVSMAGDNSIPINKRGSGVKRLILLCFFRAEAERSSMSDNRKGNVIYAFEEPETSQHGNNQRILIESFKKLSSNANIQVILTTHSPIVVKALAYSSIRVVNESDEGRVQVGAVTGNVLKSSSLSEVSYLAFGDVSEEYHDELYDFIELNNLISEFEKGKPRLEYKRLEKNGSISSRQHVLSTYIRHQIHHATNTLNQRYTLDQLRQSIEEMRNFIRDKEDGSSIAV